MSKNKYTTPICMGIVAVMLVSTILFLFGEALGIAVSPSVSPYETRLFRTDTVHSLDLVVDETDWQNLLENPLEKEYISCNAVIDGELYKNVAIRTKGNSSLSTVASSDSDRYSFKIEFDHYDNAQNYYGLDKLALNNLVQDNTCLKDYISYNMMQAFDVDAPLASYVWITVNGEDWGLYLAVEGIEEAFAQRTYGAAYGNIYKPDSAQMLGGGGRPPNAGQEEGAPLDAAPEAAADINPTAPPAADPETTSVMVPVAEGAQPVRGERPEGMGGIPGGMNSSDLALQYTDDTYSSYSNIFDNSKFAITDADKDRLIKSLQTLASGERLESAVNVEEVLRYFVVHNYLLNFDSYNSSMTHNYYLYEKDGILSMIAWDYNLAFSSSFAGVSDTTEFLNYPIDTPTAGVELEDRPMLGQLLAAYPDLYHQLFDTFLSEMFDSEQFTQMIDQATALIAPYVEKDPTSFCTVEEFESASATLREACLLRAESIRGQLDGSIPSTSEGQAADPDRLLDASHLDLSSMGSAGGGRGGEGMGEQQRPRQQDTDATADPVADAADTEANATTPEDDKRGFVRDFPENANAPPFRQAAAMEEDAASTSSRYLWLAGSLAILGLGLLFAKKFN